MIEELGHGAFGRVYLAQQRGLSNRLVAIKVTADTTLEPERLASLQHSSIVPVYSVHRAESWQAMCMPYFGRQTLASAISAMQLRDRLPHSGAELTEWMSNKLAESYQHRLSELMIPSAEDDSAPAARFGFAHPETRSNYVKSCCNVILEVARGLHHAHERGILHRDIKPANILIADDGRPMLLDFNLSSDASNHLSGSLVIGGTLPYLAPEQLESLENGSAVGVQADLFSLGVILFELLTGRLPYPIPDDHRDRLQLIPDLVQQRRSGVPGVRDFNHMVPPAVAAIVSRCLNPDPALRYQSSRDLSEDLDCELRDLPLRNTPNPSWRELISKWRRRHPRVLSLSSLLFLAGVATVLSFLVWTARERHVKHLEGRVAWQKFLEDSAETRTLLSVVDGSPAVLAEGTQLAMDVLNRFGETRNHRADQLPAGELLDARELKQWHQAKGELCYLLASARLAQSMAEDSIDARMSLQRQAIQYNSEASDLLAQGTSTVALRMQRTAILRAMGQKTEADDFTAEMISGASTAADSFVTAAQAVAAGKARQVLELLDALVIDNPTDYSIWFLNGKALAQAGRPEAAEAAFTSCIAFHPDCWRAWLERGIVRQQLSRPELAERDFSHVIAVRPDVAAAWVNRALVRIERNEFLKAIADLDQALALDGPTRCWFLRAHCHRALGDFESAAADTRFGLQARPHDETSWVARGVARLPASPNDAVSDFQQALQINPRSTAAWQNIAHVQSAYLQQLQPAIDSLSILIDAWPENTQAIAGRAVLYARQQDAESALRDIDRASKLKCQPLETYQFACVYALLSADNSQPKQSEFRSQAISWLKKSLLQDPALARIAATDSDMDDLKPTEEFQNIVSAITVLNGPKQD
ncbi:MAG: protein kinase [Planctomycetaceae bacterium]